MGGLNESVTNFYKKYFENLKYHVKRTCIFHLILVGVLSTFILYVKTVEECGGSGGVLMGNLLSMAKVIVNSLLKL